MPINEAISEERLARINARERWLVQEMERIKAEYRNRILPIVQELNDLQGHRDRSVIYNQDLSIAYTYIGPMPDYKLPEEKKGESEDPPE